MSGAHSRRKGAAFERALVLQFRDAMPGAQVQRGFQSRSGREQADVEVPAFWIEAKHHHRANMRAALRQAVECCPPGKWPVAVCKDDNQPAMVVMPLEDFLDLVNDWWSSRP